MPFGAGSDHYQAIHVLPASDVSLTSTGVKWQLTAPYALKILGASVHVNTAADSDASLQVRVAGTAQMSISVASTVSVGGVVTQEPSAAINVDKGQVIDINVATAATTTGAVEVILFCKPRFDPDAPVSDDWQGW